MSFLEKWLEAVDKKNSVVCAGLDPAEHDMGRKDKGLAPGANKRAWAVSYVEAVAPYCAAVKPNLQYWKAEEDAKSLKEIFELAESKGCVVIDDSKLADIGDTNDAGMFYGAKRAHAVTFSPFVGNIEEAAKQSKSRGIGVISMCLMTHKEYARIKNNLIMVDEKEYEHDDIIRVGGYAHVSQFKALAHDAKKFGIEGIVVGAPSPDNHLQEHEIRNAAFYAGPDMMVLCPGIGYQKGNPKMLFVYFNKNLIIGNVGRDLMLPNGSNSTADDQVAAAKKFQKWFNELRA